MAFIISFLAMLDPLLFGPTGLYITMAIIGVNMEFITLFLISSDQENNGLKFLFTTPITRKQYVTEKFSILLVLMIDSFVLTISAMYIFHNLLNWSVEEQSLINQIALVCMAITVVGFALIPLQIKFGPTKTQLFVSGIGAAVVLILGLASWIFTKTDFGQNAWDKLMELYIDDGFTPFMIAAGLVTIVILALTYWASLRSVERLEF